MRQANQVMREVFHGMQTVVSTSFIFRQIRQYPMMLSSSQTTHHLTAGKGRGATKVWSTLDDQTQKMGRRTTRRTKGQATKQR